MSNFVDFYSIISGKNQKNANPIYSSPFFGKKFYLLGVINHGDKSENLRSNGD